MKKQIKYGLLLVCFAALLTPFLSFGQVKKYSFEEVDSLQQFNRKKIIVFLNTDWCAYCQMMKVTTFKNDKVVNALNKDFYFIDFNAESKSDVIFGGTVFKYKSTLGVHQLAEQLGTIDGKLAYPTVCFLNEKLDIVYQYNEALTAKEFLKLLSEFKAK